MNFNLFFVILSALNLISSIVTEDVNVFDVKLSCEERGYLYLICSNITFTNDSQIQVLIEKNYQPESVVYRNGLITYLHPILFLPFPKSIVFEFTNNGIMEIDKYSFRQAPEKTIIIKLSGNLITEIPDNTFETLRNLKTMDLSSNEISTLHEDSFNGLVSLWNLNLSNNKLKQIKSDVFRPINIEYFNLNISFNPLESMNYLKTVGTIEAIGTNLKIFQSQDISSLKIESKYLQTIHINGQINYLSVKSDVLENITIVNPLSISGLHLGNNYPDFDCSFIEEMPKLYSLTLNVTNPCFQMNNLRFFAMKESLISVSLYAANMSTFDPKILTPMKHLETLILNDNNLSYLSVKDFSVMEKVTQLDLRNTVINDLNLENLMKRFPRLRTLDIDRFNGNCTTVNEFRHKYTVPGKILFKTSTDKIPETVCEVLN